MAEDMPAFDQLRVERLRFHLDSAKAEAEPSLAFNVEPDPQQLALVPDEPLDSLTADIQALRQHGIGARRRQDLYASLPAAEAVTESVRAALAASEQDQAGENAGQAQRLQALFGRAEQVLHAQQLPAAVGEAAAYLQQVLGAVHHQEGMQPAQLQPQHAGIHQPVLPLSEARSNNKALPEAHADGSQAAAQASASVGRPAADTGAEAGPSAVVVQTFPVHNAGILEARFGQRGSQSQLSRPGAPKPPQVGPLQSPAAVLPGSRDMLQAGLASSEERHSDGWTPASASQGLPRPTTGGAHLKQQGEAATASLQQALDQLAASLPPEREYSASLPEEASLPDMECSQQELCAEDCSLLEPSVLQLPAAAQLAGSSAEHGKSQLPGYARAAGPRFRDTAAGVTGLAHAGEQPGAAAGAHNLASSEAEGGTAADAAGARGDITPAAPGRAAAAAGMRQAASSLDPPSRRAAGGGAAPGAPQHPPAVHGNTLVQGLTADAAARVGAVAARDVPAAGSDPVPEAAHSEPQQHQLSKLGVLPATQGQGAPVRLLVQQPSIDPPGNPQQPPQPMAVARPAPSQLPAAPETEQMQPTVGFWSPGQLTAIAAAAATAAAAALQGYERRSPPSEATQLVVPASRLVAAERPDGGHAAGKDTVSHAKRAEQQAPPAAAAAVGGQRQGHTTRQGSTARPAQQPAQPQQGDGVTASARAGKAAPALVAAAAQPKRRDPVQRSETSEAVAASQERRPAVRRSRTSEALAALKQRQSASGPTALAVQERSEALQSLLPASLQRSIAATLTQLGAHTSLASVPQSSELDSALSLDYRAARAVLSELQQDAAQFPGNVKPQQQPAGGKQSALSPNQPKLTGQAGRHLAALTVHMHQDLAFDGVEAFEQAVARDVEQCIATAHVRSSAALPEEDGEPAVGTGGTKRKAMRTASPIRTAATRGERQAEQAAARSETPRPTSQDGVHPKQADSPPAAKRQRHRQQVASHPQPPARQQKRFRAKPVPDFAAQHQEFERQLQRARAQAPERAAATAKPNWLPRCALPYHAADYSQRRRVQQGPAMTQPAASTAAAPQTPKAQAPREPAANPVSTHRGKRAAEAGNGPQGKCTGAAVSTSGRVQPTTELPPGLLQSLAKAIIASHQQQQEADARAQAQLHQPHQESDGVQSACRQHSTQVAEHAAQPTAVGTPACEGHGQNAQRHVMLPTALDGTSEVDVLSPPDGAMVPPGQGALLDALSAQTAEVAAASEVARAAQARQAAVAAQAAELQAQHQAEVQQQLEALQLQQAEQGAINLRLQAEIAGATQQADQARKSLVDWLADAVASKLSLAASTQHPHTAGGPAVATAGNRQADKLADTSQDGLQAAATASVATGQPVVGEVAAGLMAAVARQSLPDRALLERVAVDVIQEELTQEMGAGLEPGDQRNIMLRTSVGVQTQLAHHEREAGGSDAATQHEEQPLAGAAPSTARPGADRQGAPVHVGTSVDTPARPHSSSMDCVDDALLELVLHALAEASLESIREQQLHQAQLLAIPAAVGAQADSGAVSALGGSDAAPADAGAAHGAVSTAPEQADSGVVPAPGGSDAAHADAGAAHAAISTAPEQAEQLGQCPAVAAATDLPFSLPEATDQHTERPDNVAGAARAAVTPMPSQQLKGEDSSVLGQVTSAALAPSLQASLGQLVAVESAASVTGQLAVPGDYEAPLQPEVGGDAAADSAAADAAAAAAEAVDLTRQALQHAAAAAAARGAAPEDGDVDPQEDAAAEAPLRQGDGAAHHGRPAVQAEPAPSLGAAAWEQQLPAAGAGGQMQAEGGLNGQAFYLVPACQLPGVLQLQQAPLGLPLMVPGSVPVPSPHPEEPSGKGRDAPAGHEAPALDMQQGSGSCGADEPADQGSLAAQGPQSPDSAAEAAGRQLQDAATSMSGGHPTVGDEAETCGQDGSAQAEGSVSSSSASGVQSGHLMEEEQQALEVQLSESVQPGMLHQEDTPAAAEELSQAPVSTVPSEPEVQYVHRRLWRPHQSSSAERYFSNTADAVPHAEQSAASADVSSADETSHVESSSDLVPSNSRSEAPGTLQTTSTSISTIGSSSSSEASARDLQGAAQEQPGYRGQLPGQKPAARAAAAFAYLGSAGASSIGRQSMSLAALAARRRGLVAAANLSDSLLHSTSGPGASSAAEALSLELTSEASSLLEGRGPAGRGVLVPAAVAVAELREATPAGLMHDPLACLLAQAEQPLQQALLPQPSVAALPGMQFLQQQAGTLLAAAGARPGHCQAGGLLATARHGHSQIAGQKDQQPVLDEKCAVHAGPRTMLSAGKEALWRRMAARQYQQQR